MNEETNLVEELTPNTNENVTEEEVSETEPVDTKETTEQPIEQDPSRPKKYHERYYLLYGDGNTKTKLDIKGTAAFLQQIGFDGGELAQARKGESKSEQYQKFTENRNTQLYCSYCGSEISGVEFDRLPDGRARCTSCSKSLVQTKKEVNEICKRVMDNLELFFGAQFNQSISIEVLDERRLKKKIGGAIGQIDDNSLLILGVAINEKGKYTILLENGAPRISIIATFAHELTHIWQYMNWDSKKGFPKCSPKNRLLIYEGMAKWVEIQYLYLIGESTVAKREEEITRRRNDEYGIGFRIYENQYPLSYEAMTCDQTPFTTDGYPIK